MRLSEAIKFSGIFWIEGNYEDRTFGTLSISEEGKATLDMISEANDASPLCGEDSLASMRIVGTLENNHVVTLDKCQYVQRSLSADGRLFKSQMIVGFVFLGAMYDEGEVITFSKVSFSMIGLDEWLGITGFKVSPNIREMSAKIQFDRPKDISCYLEGLSLFFKFSSTIPLFDSLTKVDISQGSYLSLSVEEEMTLTDFLPLIARASNFIRFG